MHKISWGSIPAEGPACSSRASPTKRLARSARVSLPFRPVLDDMAVVFSSLAKLLLLVSEILPSHYSYTAFTSRDFNVAFVNCHHAFEPFPADVISQSPGKLPLLRLKIQQLSQRR